MKEELINFKTAKMAKKKGFNISTLYFWNTNKKSSLNRGVKYMSDDKENNDEDYGLPIDSEYVDGSFKREDDELCELINKL